MLKYDRHLKSNARQLRANMTDSEQMLWNRLRRRQVLDIQFYRQKPIGNFIVDFYAPKVKLVVEVDGSQHLELIHQRKDEVRDSFLSDQGLHVLRFDSRQVIKELKQVAEKIYYVIKERLDG